MPTTKRVNVPSPQSKPFIHSGCHAPLSGSYQLHDSAFQQLPRNIVSITMRLDIDGWYPGSVISYTIVKKATRQKAQSDVHIVTRAHQRGGLTWECVVIKTCKGKNPFRRKMVVTIVSAVKKKCPVADVTITTRSGITRTLRFKRISAFFHPLQIEYDCMDGVKCITSIKPLSHPLHPPDQKAAPITIKKILQQTGFDIAFCNEHSKVPIEYTGDDNAWSDQELHDAMLSYWSNFFNDEPQWSLWMLFANRREGDDSCGGIMFDTSSRLQRRGMALFNDSSYFNGNPQDHFLSAWKKRMKFFTLCHELGHTFNLHHPSITRKSWLRTRPANGTIGFMHNPVLFKQGKGAFFSEFSYRFTNDDLLFIRHAPEEYVKMGCRAWMDDTALSLYTDEKKCRFSFKLSTGRPENRFTFMEPVVVECTLKNCSEQVQTIDIPDRLLSQTMSFWIEGAHPLKRRSLRPFLQSEYLPVKRTINPGASLYTSVLLSVGVDGWIIMEPGIYSVVACWNTAEESVWSTILSIRVDPPCSQKMEILAQDYFSDDVGRVLAFDGSAILTKANDCLKKCLEPGIPAEVALHARIALAIPLKYPAKTLTFKKGTNGSPPHVAQVMTTKPFHDLHKKELEKVLFWDPIFAASTLGNFEYKMYVDNFSLWLMKNNLIKEAYQAQEKLYMTLIQRGIKKESTMLVAIKDKIASIKSKQTGAN